MMVIVNRKLAKSFYVLVEDARFDKNLLVAILIMGARRNCNNLLFNKVIR